MNVFVPRSATPTYTATHTPPHTTLHTVMQHHTHQLNKLLAFIHTSWCNGSTLDWNARDAGLMPTLGTIFPIFVSPITLVAVTIILYKLLCVVVEPTLCMCMYM